MFKNYLKIALRNLLKHKGYSFINIAGLALGMACCILIFQWVRFELSYDMFHPAAERIYRVVQEQRFSGSVQQVAVVSAPVAPALVNEYPEMESAVRLRPRAALVSYSEKKFFGERIVYADSNVFKFFAFPLLVGNQESALGAPNTLVISENMARKYFGNEEPMGKTLRFNDRYDYTVTGVMKNVPANSQFYCDAIAAFSVFYKDFNFTSLHSEVAPLVIIYDPKEILPITVRIRPENVSATLTALEQTWNRLSPAWPFEYSFLDAEIDALYRADEKVGQIFGVFAAIAIVIACLGLFGLASYTAERRTKEIGVRKVLGASVSRIVALLSKEFLQLVLLANVLAWPIAYFAMNKWLEDFAYRINLGFTSFALAAVLALVIAFVTVSYQALKAALANPVEALRYE